MCGNNDASLILVMPLSSGAPTAGLKKTGPAILGFVKGNAMELSAVLTPATEGGFVALNPETGTTSQGETVEEALANLREATELYLEEFPLTVMGRSLLTTFHVTALA